MFYFILFFFGLALALTIRFRKKSRLMLKLGVCLISGFMISISPLLIRNLTVGASVFCTTSAGGFTFIGANTPDYPGESFYLSMKYGPEIMGETDGKFFPGIIESLKTHSGIFSYLKLLGRKFYNVWHWYEAFCI